MSAVQTCPRCGAPLDAGGAEQQVCARCLLQAVLEAEDERSPPLTENAPEPSRPGAGDSSSADIAQQRHPSHIGPYRLLSILGSGGMGVVYLADQQQPLRRRVALKLVRPGLDTSSVLRRFDAERQALALMTHPGITRVLDAGADEAGRPYFVMELVEGEPITQYCDQQRLSTAARLALFADVCAAVQHAHQKGIIHRDLKPSNILVIEEEGRPVPKIIDFGVAKALEQRLTEATLFTELGVIIGTPEYMSPEQADARAADIDARTDVYALGVVLYELLVGAQPFDAATLRQAGFEEIRRVIRDVDPPTPSSRLTALGADAAKEIAHRRRTDTAALRRLLRGELDWVCLKALEKDRARRYGSASELAGDIQRFVRHEPVTARPPAVHYRVRKYLRRRRVGVIASVAVALALALGFGASVLLPSRPTTALPDIRLLTRSGFSWQSLVSPDGQHVVFTQRNRDRRGESLWLAEASSGSIERLSDLPVALTTQLLRWSRDGRHIYLGIEEVPLGPILLHRLSLADHRIERLQTTGSLPHWPVLAPDERRIAGVRDDLRHRRSVLVVANLDGSEEREVAARPLEEPYFMPAWSPDGKTIACSVGNLGMIGTPMRVMNVDVADGREHPLSREGWTRAKAKTWLPDGSSLLLLGQKWGEKQTADSWLWRLDTRTGQSRRISTGPDEFSGWQMSLSADGKTLSATRSRLAANLWVLDGTDSALAREIAPAWEAPRFFPDGRVLFTSMDGFIWRMNADGSSRLRVADGFYKAVTRDGRSIVFSREHQGVSQIWRTDADGRSPTQITYGPAATKPEISPDRNWIVYITAVDGALWKIPFAGGEAVRLANGVAGVPDISPDGQWVAVPYRDPTGGPWTPAFVPMAGGGIARRLKLAPGTQLWHLRFTRDGKAIDVALSAGGGVEVGNLWRMPLDGGPLVQLTHFASEELRSFDWSWDGKLLACLRGGWRGDIVLLRGGW